MKFKLKKIGLLSLILVLTTQCKKTDSVNSGIGPKSQDSRTVNNEKPTYLGDSTLGVRKLKDIVIYKDSLFFSTFPSVVTRPDGEILVAFRRALERKNFGESKTYHVDANSYLAAVRSKDYGDTWTKSPELIYANPFGGSQDPCMLQLRDGTILCVSYGWSFVRQDGLPNLKDPYFSHYQVQGAIFAGGYLVRSTDGGKTWGDVIYPPHIAPEIMNDAFGSPVASYNRGALYEANDGRILWIVAAHDTATKTSNHLIVSNDKGLTWDYISPVAVDDKISFNEASIIETPKGDLVGFLRTADYDDQAVISRSTDGGKTFKWESMGFQGHPLNALRLKDNRVLLTYGYRHEPYGIRARILNPECTDFATAPEIVIRDDGGSWDLGYTWATQFNDGRVLVVYYFNQDNGPRYIAGTILEIENK
ncbi:sialidase family protein [Arenibacter algicola]|uniref:exo-alpha-sialidase n=1 Tax=Arenibacter algicola TaxID=616991 RepID=A0A221UTP5_9FLAO|nr:sialidase family protein [Arenibacter algicola]ASO04620.1 BNR repeat-like domain protein [Arenibacter algicola]